MFEVITPEQFTDVMVEMDKDDRRYEKELVNDKRWLYKALREYSEYGEINIVKVIKIIDVKFRSRFKDSELDVVAEIVAYDESFKKTIHGKIKFKYYSWSGSFYEPPFDETDVCWIPKPGIVKVNVPRSVIDNNKINKIN